MRSSDLDSFVDQIDRAGGAGSDAFAELVLDFDLLLEAKVDESLDPFGEAYVAQQISVWSEIAGRTLDQGKWEPQEFDLESVAARPCATPLGNPVLSRHLRALSSVSELLCSNRPFRVLDMGCGWGLSSEHFAQLGGVVTAVDISPAFVELVRRRAQRLGLKITAHESSFEAFESSEKFDLILFYESLHHSVRPWEIVRKVSGMLSEDGVVALLAEPIGGGQRWGSWGVRVDPLSVYCIRKFGWFETGWSEWFVQEMFARAGLRLQLCPWIGIDRGYIGLAAQVGSRRHPFDVSSLHPITHERWSALEREMASLRAAAEEARSARPKLSLRQRISSLFR